MKIRGAVAELFPDYDNATCVWCGHWPCSCRLGFVSPRRERCKCGAFISAGGYPDQVLIDVMAHNRTEAHRAYSARLHAFLHDDGPRPDATVDLSGATFGASAVVVEEPA